MSAGAKARAAAILRQIIDEMPNATGARLELAQLLDRMGDKEGAWRQLRAVRAGGLPREVAKIVDRYSDALRAERAIGASLEIAVAPDSNISRATRSDTLSTVIGDFQIDEDSKAKSGVGLALSGQAFRRLALSKNAMALVRLSGSADLYKHKRFNDIAVDLAVGPELDLGRSRVNLEIGGTLRFYGQKPFMRAARLAGSVTLPVGSRSRLWAKGAASLLDQKVNNLQDGKGYSAQLIFEHALTRTTGVLFSLAGERESLRDPGYSTRGWRAGLIVWRDVGRSTASANLEYGRLRADERLSLFPDRRSDRLLRLTIGATFRQLNFNGYAPVARIIVERNSSTIAFYDFKRVRTEFGIARAF